MIKVPILYHGTDARFVTLPDNIRQGYKTICINMINFFLPKFHQFFLKPEEEVAKAFLADSLESNPTILPDFQQSLAEIELSGQGCGDYQYEHFYVTSSWLQACIYAKDSFVGGELARHTYNFLRAAKLMGMLDDSQNKAIEDFYQVMNRIASEEPKPVIFTFKDIRPEDLLTEQGEKIDKYVREDGRIVGVNSFRLLTTPPLDLDNAKYIDYEQEIANFSRKSH